MAEQPTGKLVVILHADVIGSTALVQRDERRAHERITSVFQRFSQIIQEYGGEAHEIRGDALLAEFSRASDAVCAALVFQKRNTNQNKSIEDDIVPEVRIGIALGEVVIADNTVTGAGVVLAQRVEQLCEPGGVYITEAIREALPSRLPLDSQNLGKHELKGFEKSVRVYAVALQLDAEVPAPEVQQSTKPKRTPLVLSGVVSALVVIAIALAWLKPWQPDTEPASEDRMAYALPGKPSIAVLPFENLSGDPEQEYLAGGITEEIITTLSQVPDLFVIAGSSTDTYKDRTPSAKQVAEEQGVRYVLEGSMQRTGDRIRINTQLTDALAGSHVWAERYDRELKDLFALQDQITRNIALAMQAELTEGDLVWRRAKGLDPEALRLVFKARKLMDRITEENVAKARQILIKARAISPGAVFPLVSQGWLDAYEARYGWSPSRDDSLHKAEAIAGEILEKEKTYPEALMLRGYTHVLRSELDKAIPYYELAVDANPNHARAIGGLGWSLVYAGRPEEAIPVLKKAMRLSPYHPGWMDGTLGLAYMMTGEYDLAIQANKDMIAKEALVLFGHERLTAIYALKGDMGSARKYAAKVLELKPDFSIEGWSNVLKYKRQEDLDRELNALRKAGLPEKPPLELPDKPSIAVLPFTNMSGDPEQEYFADGITEDIITELSRFKDFFVISRTSTFAYKDKSIKVQDIGRELGVRYLLEGSVRRSGEDLRITAQLIDAQTGNHIWAEKYDRQTDEVFTIQDEINGAIVTTLGETLWQAAAREVARKPTSSFEAYDFLLKANEALHRLTKDDNLKARNLYKKALEFDIDFAAPYRGLAWTYLLDFITQWVTAGEAALDRALEYTHKAIALESDSAGAHRLLGRISQARGNYDEALARFERALELNPNDGDILASYGSALVYSGRSEEGIKWAKEAIRRNPHHPDWYGSIIALGYYFEGRYGDVLLQLSRIERPRMWDHRLLAAAYAQSGNLTKAKEHVTAMLAINPETSISTIKPAAAFKNATDVDRYLEGLRKAGMPE